MSSKPASPQRGPRVRDLGWRLSWWLALQTFIGLGLVCLAVYAATSLSLRSRQQETLAQKQLVLRHLVQESHQMHDLPGLQHSLDDFLAGHEDLTLRLLDAQGRTIYPGADGAGPGLVRPNGTRAGSPRHPGTPQLSRFEIALPQNAAPLRAEMALDTGADEQLLRRLALTLAAASIIGALGVSVGGFWLVRLGLSPLRQLVDQTRALSAQQLDRRLDGSAQPAELQPLIEQFNALLERLSRAYRQMEGFNADVAHELNTPLATLISSCELALRKARGAEELRELLGSNLEELHRLAAIVADMLFLSRADRGASARRQPLDSLARLAGEVLEYHEAALQEAGLEARIEGDASGALDAPLLRRALSNLLGNATRYARAGSVLRVEIAQPAPGLCTLTVVNEGETLSDEHLPRLFDRFYRADPARSRSEVNHGLGLSIVAAIARMHGGQPFAESGQGLTRVGLTLALA